MSCSGMNPNRRYSLLEVSGGAGRLRPRSSSTSVVTVTEPSPELRIMGDRRPPPTPCSTPCFVSPRLAFSTQFNYDSPIQVITCSSGNVLKPVTKWTSRFSVCSGKGLLVVAVLALCFVGCVWMGGKEVLAPASEETHFCDAHGTGVDCGDAHPVTSSLQLQKEASMHNQFPDDQHRTAQEESEEVEAEGGQEERNYRPRVPTVQGQYENVREHLADEPPSNVNPTRRGGEARSHVTLSSEDLQAVREGLARAKRSLIAEGRDAMQSNRDNLQKSMRVIEGDMSQDIPDRSPQPQYEPGRHPSPHHEAARPFQPHQGHRHQLNFVADSRPQPPQESIGLPQNTREDLANQYMSEENGQNHFRQPQLRQDIIGHTRSYTEGSPKPPMPDEDLKTNLRSLSSQNDHHRQPQQQQYEIGQTHLFHEDHQGQQITEEVRQSQFRQIPPQHQVLGEPQPQEQPYRALDVRPDNPNPEDERQRQQQTLDQLYIQHMNLERNNYHREKQIVEKEISHRELLRHSEQERLWEEQRRQTHNRLPQEQPRTPPQHERMPQNQRTPGSGFEQRESGRHREEFIPYDERHPAWRDQRLPRGVNPKRYHIHNDL